MRVRFLFFLLLFIFFFFSRFTSTGFIIRRVYRRPPIRSEKSVQVSSLYTNVNYSFAFLRFIFFFTEKLFVVRPRDKTPISHRVFRVFVFFFYLLFFYFVLAFKYNNNNNKSNNIFRRA